MTQKIKAGAKATVAARRERLTDLMLGDRRMTQARAAKELRCSVATINGDYQALLKEWRNGAASRVALETERQLSELNRLSVRLFDDLTPKEDPFEIGTLERIPPEKCVDLLIKIFGRRARLLGLDSEVAAVPTAALTISVKRLTPTDIGTPDVPLEEVTESTAD